MMMSKLPSFTGIRSPSRIVVPAGARGVLLLPGIVTDYQRICDILLVGYYWCHLLLFVIGPQTPLDLGHY
ncbi:hypothetical protein Tco_1189809 [Tanacetum coccineum]